MLKGRPQYNLECYTQLPPPPPPQKKKLKTKKLVFNSCEIIMHAALMSKVRTGKNMDSASALLMS